MLTAITTWQTENAIGLRITIHGEHVGEHVLEDEQSLRTTAYVYAFELLFNRAKAYIERWKANEEEAASERGGDE